MAKRNKKYYSINIPFESVDEKNKFIEEMDLFIESKTTARNPMSLGALAYTAIEQYMERNRKIVKDVNNA